MPDTVADALNKAVFSYLLMVFIATLAACMIRGIVILLAKVQDRRKAEAPPTPVLVSVTPARDESAAIAAAIAAAVYTMIGAHRLLYIGEARHGFGWTSEIRSRLHTSHTPRQTGR
jgi:hypothetical protein